jgi:hypothetical protein
VNFLLLFLFLAFLGGLVRAGRPRAATWPLVPLAFGLALLYLNYSMI